MVSVTRPGQRHINIPGIGVQTSRRAVASGANWSQWLTYAWVFKGAASQAASYTDVLSGQVLTAGADPGWDATNGLIFNGAQYLKIGLTPAQNQTWSMCVLFAGATRNVVCTLVGMQGNVANNSFSIDLRFTTEMQFRNGSTLISSGISANSGVAVIAGATAYMDAVAKGAIPAGSADTIYAIYLGAQNYQNSPMRYYTGNIQFLGIKTSSPWTSGEVTSLTTAVNAI